jgi:hypothetical protein
MKDTFKVTITHNAPKPFTIEHLKDALDIPPWDKEEGDEYSVEAERLNHCDVCGITEEQWGEFTFMMHGFNGIKKGSKDDIGQILCPQCEELHDKEVHN